MSEEKIDPKTTASSKKIVVNYVKFREPVRLAKGAAGGVVVDGQPSTASGETRVNSITQEGPGIAIKQTATDSDETFVPWGNIACIVRGPEKVKA